MPHDVNNTLAKLISIVLESYKAYGLYNSLSTTQNNILFVCRYIRLSDPSKTKKVMIIILHRFGKMSP